jgi:hypothetical protein
MKSNQIKLKCSQTPLAVEVYCCASGNRRSRLNERFVAALYLQGLANVHGLAASGYTTNPYE